MRVNTSTTETIMSEAAQLIQHDRSHQISTRDRLPAFSRPVALPPSGRASSLMDDTTDLHDGFSPFQGFQSLQDPQQRMLEMMRTVRELVQPASKVVRPGDVLYHSGLPFNTVFLINSGAYKLVSRSLDGREQIVSLKFRGDWLGFSGIAHGRHACDAVAMDTGNVSIIPYATLLEGCVRHPELMAVVHEAMSTEIRRERESLMSVCTLASQARVAEFLCAWARSMAQRGLRADELTLRMTRADLGNYLGMTLETVSRCLSRLNREQLIRFGERGRRQISIPDLARLEQYVISGSSARTARLQ